MNLKIIEFENNKTDTILLSKTGVLRFKSSFIENNNVKKEDRWHIALDDDERDKYRTIYLLKETGNAVKKGKRITQINKSYFIDCKVLLSYLKISESIKCTYNKFHNGNMAGFCIILPN